MEDENEFAVKESHHHYRTRQEQGRNEKHEWEFYHHLLLAHGLLQFGVRHGTP
jgi:hypothetical protein